MKQLIPAMGASLAVRALSVRHVGAKAPLLAVDQASFECAPGSRTVLVGRSGSGKSTILKAVGGFLPAASGEILVDGARVGRPGPDRFVVWRDQEQLLAWKSVLANVLYPLELRGAQGAAKTARDWLGRVGLAREAHRFPHELPEGMRMRAAIARAFASQPRLLLMDEPFSALDALAREKMQNLLTQLQEETGLTLLFVTHDLSEALRLGQRVVVLSSSPGRVAGVFEPTPASREVTAQEIGALLFRRGEEE